MKILIIEDNPNLRENLIYLLKQFHHLGEGAENGHIGLEKLSQGKYDAIVLDLEMPEMTGQEFMQVLKTQKNAPPVIVLTSYGQLEDKLNLFDLWAQDYITKPVEIEELLARLNIITQRNISAHSNNFLQYKSIKLFPSQGKVEISGNIISLSQKQFLILEYLMRTPNIPQKKIDIMQYVWGESEENLEFHSTTLESHIYALRKKLWDTSLKTLKGFGYMID